MDTLYVTTDLPAIFTNLHTHREMTGSPASSSQHPFPVRMPRTRTKKATDHIQSDPELSQASSSLNSAPPPAVVESELLSASLTRLRGKKRGLGEDVEKSPVPEPSVKRTKRTGSAKEDSEIVADTEGVGRGKGRRRNKDGNLGLGEQKVKAEDLSKQEGKEPEKGLRRGVAVKQEPDNLDLDVDGVAIEANGTSRPNKKKDSRKPASPIKKKAKLDHTAGRVDDDPTDDKKRNEIKVEVELDNEDTAAPPPAKKAKIQAEPRSKSKSKPKPKLKHQARDESEESTQDKLQDSSKTPTNPPAKPKRPRKTAEKKAREATPLAPRTPSIPLHIGAHVSMSGGVPSAILNAVHIGANAFALFLKSQRKWANPPLSDEHSSLFHAHCKTHSYAADKHIVPHGSYLVNLCAKDVDKAKQAYDTFLDDVQRCERLGISLYNFHPGNTNGEPRAEALSRLANHLNAAHKRTKNVTTLLENMAAAPGANTVGGTFEDLRDIIALVHDKSRIGVTLDTCHAFAAGYDLRTPTAFGRTMDSFSTTVGIQYLRAVHLNDSKAPFASHRDLHQRIGSGFLGLRAFHSLVNDARFHGLPLVLETPLEEKEENGKMVDDHGTWAREIKLLENLVGMDPEGEEFTRLEKELGEKGAAERAKMAEAAERKAVKLAKGEAKAKTKTKTKMEMKSKGGAKTTGTKKGVSERGSDSGDESGGSSSD